MSNIVIVGAGAFGTALAVTFLKSGHHVILMPRRSEQALEMQKTRMNTRYLDGVVFPDSVVVSSDPVCLQEADIVVIATPTQFTVPLFSELKSFIPKKAAFIVASKGIVAGQTLSRPFIPDWLYSNFSKNPLFVLSGPNFAKEIAQGLPAAATLAGQDELETRAMAQSLRNNTYLLYPSTDMTGVLLAGAIKNVYAIAAGMCSGLSLGQSALASMITRALAEMKRLGVVMGAEPETFLGLCGVGDLMLTCTSLMSRNMSLGVELASGRSLNAILSERHSVAEGVETSKALYALLQHYNVRMPIAVAVYQILHESADMKQVLARLLDRQDIPLETD